MSISFALLPHALTMSAPMTELNYKTNRWRDKRFFIFLNCSLHLPNLDPDGLLNDAFVVSLY